MDDMSLPDTGRLSIASCARSLMLRERSVGVVGKTNLVNIRLENEVMSAALARKHPHSQVLAGERSRAGVHRARPS